MSSQPSFISRPVAPSCFSLLTLSWMIYFYVIRMSRSIVVCFLYKLSVHKTHCSYSIVLPDFDHRSVTRGHVVRFTAHPIITWYKPPVHHMLATVLCHRDQFHYLRSRPRWQIVWRIQIGPVQRRPSIVIIPLHLSRRSRPSLVRLLLVVLRIIEIWLSHSGNPLWSRVVSYPRVISFGLFWGNDPCHRSYQCTTKMIDAGKLHSHSHPQLLWW